MAGFQNDIMFASNVDFTGANPPVAQMVSDGQLLIGSSVAPFLQANTLTAGTGIAITNGHGTITITNTGSGGGGGGTTSLAGNSGSATQSGGVISVPGTNGLSTSGSGNTLTLTTTGSLLALNNLAGNGYVVQTGANTFVNRTFIAGSGITLTNPDGVAAGTTITASPAVPLTFTEDAGSAVPAANNLNILGTSAQGISTSGSGSSVTITASNATATQKGVASFNSTNFTVTAGAVTSNALTVTAGTGLTTGGSVNLGGSVTLALSVPVSVSNGGTGDTSLTTNGVLLGSGTSPVAVTSPGTNGQVLIGSTGAAPAFGTVTGTQGVTITGGANTLSIGLSAVPNSALQNSSITLANGNNITVTGSPVSLGGTATINVSGTTSHAVQIGNGAGSLTSVPVGGNGTVLLGATGADPAFALLTSTDGSISFTTGANSLNLKANAPAASMTLTPDDGGAVSPSANNINVNGIIDGSTTAQITMTHNQSGNLTIEDRSFLTAFVVDPSTTIGVRGTFSTIQSAINAAVSGQDVFIRPGTYTENLTLKAGVNLVGFAGDELTSQVIILGKASFSSAGTVTISNVQLKTNSDNFLAVTGSAASVVNLRNCFLNCNNATGIAYSSSSSSSGVNLYFCVGDCGATGTYFNYSGAANPTQIENCVLLNSGLSTTASTVSAGGITMEQTRITVPLTTSGSGSYTIRNCIVECAPINTTALTTAGSSNAISAVYTRFNSGTASSISVGTGTKLILHECCVSSSNTNAITGAGTLAYNPIAFIGASSTINTTTQNPQNYGPVIPLAGGPWITSGSGSPNGSVTAPKGSLYLRTDGTNATNRAFINTDGSTTWTALTTVG